MVKRPKIAFRTDASLKIGTGHVMRCLTLANALHRTGCECLFVSRELDGNLIDLVASLGFEVIRLNSPFSRNEAPSSPSHAHWAEVPWMQDADETGIALSGFRPDWVVLDHYSFDYKWEHRVVAETSAKLFVIDDLADRYHQADLLLDQTVGRQSSDYENLVPATCQILAGTKFSLLREEFANRRAMSLLERNQKSIKRILVTLGGVDLGNTTTQVLKKLLEQDLPSEVEVSVILGSTAPHLSLVKSFAKELPFKCDVYVNATNMAELFSKADIAIGAAGSTSWERCCVGLPSIVLVTAPNQLHVANALAKAEVAIPVKELCTNSFAEAFNQISSASVRKRMSDEAANICDGDGAWRVASKIGPDNLEFRKADIRDARRVWDWRNEVQDKRFSMNRTQPSYAEHYRWFQNALTDPCCQIFIFMIGRWPFAYLRLDKVSNSEASISICLEKMAQGTGMGTKILQHSKTIAKKSKIDFLDATVHIENVSSIRAFEKTGFKKLSQSSSFFTYQLSISGGC
ncbi:UDP-2,4-diacetamido-2,4,6-trideoxy-beta-L-altropyranose hydrolase [Roseibium sp. SCP14]|uniref:UDP-2,4-diacetamido-2,4, 6-trideoxy-beta-L-altropyranose hydrolase n=1 Tax=Roseibium sp. SCP14 TaxID=3141375 RepID=UPI00333921D3